MSEEDIILSITKYCSFNKNKVYYSTPLIKLFMQHIQNNKGEDGLVLFKQMVQRQGSSAFMESSLEKGILTRGNLCTCGGENWRIK